MQSENPLLAALPPAVDYLSYLTIIEYNLKQELLPTLHEVLQDATLTENIGWDLVHLLLPYLPASESCLQDIARLGNPREVILKVTECLRAIGRPEDEEADDNADQPEVATSAAPSSNAQFTALTSMLSVLHARIRTKYPSRFISASLQATLAALSRSSKSSEGSLSASIKLAKSLSNTHRGQAPPKLPPRAASTSSIKQPQPSAPDPEAETDVDAGSTAEADIQRRLLQSFVTHVLETYVTGLGSDRDIPGLAWSARLHEKSYPERIVKGKTSMTESFAADESLRSRVRCIDDALELATALCISNEDLVQAASTSESDDPSTHVLEEDEPPKHANDIPLSRHGALLLLAARVFDEKADMPSLQIWPHSAAILQSAASDAGEVHSGIGSESEGVLDAILTLALHSVANNHVGQPRDGTEFNQYLQAMSLIASNCPSPSLRFQAYYLATTILRSNPSDVERLGFIHDTLEHCPFDNLKVAAVSWIKGEIIEANPPSAPDSRARADPTVFSIPIALDSLGPFLFPDLTQELSSPDVVAVWETFDQQSPFYLASLNFYFLLLSAKHLWKPLALPALHTNNDVAGSFLQPLRDAVARFRSEAEEDSALAGLWRDKETRDEKLGQLKLMQYTLDKVTQAVIALNDAE